MTKNSVLITGGAGFVGSHLVDHFVSKGYFVHVLDNFSTGSMANLPVYFINDIQINDIDILYGRDYFDHLVDQCDLVIHCAASVGVKHVLDNPLGMLNTNVLGTHSILESCSRYSKPVVLFSTSEVYGKGDNFSEDSDIVIGPSKVARWGYAASKAIDEFFGMAYAKSGLPVTIIRLFNTVGPRQSARYGMVIPTFVKKALRGSDLPVYGTGMQKRCFTHISDVVEAIDTLLYENGMLNQKTGVYNIGNTEEISIYDLAKLIIDKVSKKFMLSVTPNIKFVDPTTLYGSDFEDMQRRVPDISKMRNLGWEPKKTLDNIINDVIYYYTKDQEVTAI